MIVHKPVPKGSCLFSSCFHSCFAFSVHNTFPVAMGLKTAGGWNQAECLYHKEIHHLTSGGPHMLFHGVLMKLVPVFCVRLASLADKPERAVVTSTISYNSTLHRRHGVAGQVFQPNYNKQSLGKLFSEEWSGTRENHWGWAKLNLDTTAPQPNGARLATCSDCRLKRLQQLIHGFTQESPACGDCADWDLLTTNKKVSLDFQAHKDYPTRCFAGSPVTPPVGRDSFEAGAGLPFVKLTFSWMKQACKFAFYQASRPGKQGNFRHLRDGDPGGKHCI